MSEISTIDRTVEFRCPYCGSPAAADATELARRHCPECGASFRLEGPSGISSLDEARLLGRFQVLQRVGSGGFGVVWRARDTSLDRIVALKVPHANLLDSASLLERFRREGRAVARLRHPGIVTVHEILEVEGLPVLVSDFIAGAPLKDLLEQRRLTFRESASLVADVADALGYAHEQGLVHRDVKPGNIMIESPRPAEGGAAGTVGRPLVVDFGLALRDEAEVVLTLDGQLVGTPAYMSPEQAAGKGHPLDGRSDIYSLGVVLYQLLCNELPFRGSRAMLIHQVLNEQPKPPRKLNDRIPRDLETVCLKAMAKEPAWRYPTAGEFAEDLRRYLRGEPVRARPLGRARRLWLWCRRNRALAAASALAAAALACLLALALAFALRERHNAARVGLALREARRQLAEVEVNRGLALCEQGDSAHGLLWLARGLRSAPAEEEPLRRYLRLSLAAWQSRHCTLRECLAIPGRVQALAFTPDGASCLALDHDGTCYRRDHATGAQEVLRRVAARGFQPAALGASTAVTGGADGTVQRWRLPAFEPVGPPLRLLSASPVRRVALSEEAGLLVAGGGGASGNVTLWKEEQGRVLPPSMLSHGSELRCLALTPDGRLALTGGIDGKARLWDTSSGKLVHVLDVGATVACGAFSPDGQLIVTGCERGRLRLWDGRSGQALDAQARHAQRVNAVAFSPDGRFVLSGSRDKTARLWSRETLEPIGSPLRHAATVEALAISRDGAQVLTGDAEGHVRLWSVPGRACLGLNVSGGGWVRDVAFSPDGRALLTGEGKNEKAGVGRLWDARTGRLLGTPLVHKDLVLAVAYSPDNRTVATAGADGLVQLADAPTGRAGPVLRHSESVYFVSFSPSGDLVLTGSDDRTARLWESKTGKPVGRPLEHGKPVLAGGFSPRGEFFCTGSHDGTLSLWRAEDRARLFSRGHADPILKAVFSHDGTMIAATSGKEVRIYEVPSGAPLAPLVVHRGLVRAVAFSPDDRLLLSGGEDGTAQIHELAGPPRRAVTLQHGQAVKAACFSPDGRLVLTGSADGRVRLWDAAAGLSVGPELRHRGRVSSLRFSPGGSRFVTGSSSGTGRLWHTPVPLEGDPEAVARRIELRTGLELDEHEGLRVLDPAAWQERGRGGPEGQGP